MQSNIFIIEPTYYIVHNLIWFLNLISPTYALGFITRVHNELDQCLTIKYTAV